MIQKEVIINAKIASFFSCFIEKKYNKSVFRFVLFY